MTLELFSGLAKIELLETEFSRFKIKVKKLLTENSKSRLKPDEQEQRLKRVFEILTDFNPFKSSKKYRSSHRDEFNDFSDKMLKLLPVLEKTITNLDPIELKINLGTDARPKSKLFKLPVSPQGHSHFLSAFKDFILEYYEDNPTFKYYKGLEPGLSLKYFQEEKKHGKRLNLPTLTKLKDRFIFDLHLTLLFEIKTFTQFKSKQVAYYSITNHQAIFILKLLNLLDYNKSYNDLYDKTHTKPIIINLKALEDNFITTLDIKKLRNDLFLYNEAIKTFSAKKA